MSRKGHRLSPAAKLKISAALKGNKNAQKLGTRQKVANINASLSKKKMTLSPEQIARRQGVAKRLRAQARKEETAAGTRVSASKLTPSKSRKPTVNKNSRAGQTGKSLNIQITRSSRDQTRINTSKRVNAIADKLGLSNNQRFELNQRLTERNRTRDKNQLVLSETKKAGGDVGMVQWANNSRLRKLTSAGKSPNGKDFRSMTSAQKVKAAEIMHGTGSKQHRTAQKKFTPAPGSTSGKKVAVKGLHGDFQVFDRGQKDYTGKNRVLHVQHQGRDIGTVTKYQSRTTVSAPGSRIAHGYKNVSGYVIKATGKNSNSHCNLTLKQAVEQVHLESQSKNG